MCNKSSYNIFIVPWNVISEIHLQFQLLAESYFNSQIGSIQADITKYMIIKELCD